MIRALKHLSAILTVTLLLASCSATRHVPQDEYLLDKARIVMDTPCEVNTSQLRNYLRQQPNHKVLGCMRLQLGMYNMSGRDSTRWYNRWARSLGQPPVIYGQSLTLQSALQLRQAMINRGYTHATVTTDTCRRGRRIDVTYRIDPGQPHRIASLTYDIPDTLLEQLVARYPGDKMLHTGAIFDRGSLDLERTRLTRLMRDNGYYSFNSEYISYIADTTAHSSDLALTLVLRNPRHNEDTTLTHRRAVISRVTVNTAYSSPNGTPLDTVATRGYDIVYGPDRYLRPSIIIEKCYIDAGDTYSATAVQDTYEAFSQLGIVKYVNITFTPDGERDGHPLLACNIELSRMATHGVIFELEGTNSEGDLGVGAAVTYQHRNLAHHSELLTVKVRGSYESLSGNLEGLINNRYTEVGAEVGITFPKFELPLMSRRLRRRVKAVTEFAFTANYQERPEYTRLIAGAGMKYKWYNRRGTSRRTLELIDINYVSLPRSTIDFINTVAPTNPLLRYSYEDHFIMRLGYSVYRTNRLSANNTAQRTRVLQSDIWSWRLQAETAGNLLWAVSQLSGMRRHDGVYKILGIQYAQYVKGSAGYTWNHFFNNRNSVALHAEGGIAYPYGNSTMVPFEKRFYAGGANGVRGWGVRTLGPGSYDSTNDMIDFINQCGDISLFLSAEYRPKLFWVLEGALFIDAGNIWTIRNYENQPGGLLTARSFLREIALGYGVGLRFDFSYFLLRLDLGLKAHDPARNHERWPLTHPRWKRDATFHFSVGYPF